MALVVVDAGVVIAFRTPQDVHHEAAVQALLHVRADTLVLPASAYSELLVQPAEQGAQAIARARRIVDGFPMRVEPIGREVAERAAILRRHVRLPDALVLATGDILGADVVLTTDTRWKRVSRRVRVVA